MELLNGEQINALFSSGVISVGKGDWASVFTAAAMPKEIPGHESGQAAAFFREYLIPAVNNAHQDGVAGKAGYPNNPVSKIAAFEKTEEPLCSASKYFITTCIYCLNAAYAQRRRDGGTVGRKESPMPDIKSQILELFLQLTEEQQMAAIDMVLFMLNADNEETSAEQEKEDTVG